MDELFTFIGKKSNPIRVWTAVDRDSEAFVGFSIGNGSGKSLKSFLTQLSKKYAVDFVCTDGNCCYEEYVNQSFEDAKHCVSKAETGLVESFNFVLRHYLGRLKRKSVALLVKKFNARFEEPKQKSVA